MTNVRGVVRALASVATVLAFSGCGLSSDGIDRQPVSGLVTLDGKPLGHGSILFSLIDHRPSAGGTVVEGAFSIAGSEGPAPGSYQVEIVNAQSELKADMTKNGPNVFTFSLSSALKRSLAKKRF